MIDFILIILIIIGAISAAPVISERNSKID